MVTRPRIRSQTQPMLALSPRPFNFIIKWTVEKIDMWQVYIANNSGVVPCMDIIEHISKENHRRNHVLPVLLSKNQNFSTKCTETFGIF